jgi:hypothetical protein
MLIEVVTLVYNESLTIVNSTFTSEEKLNEGVSGGLFF